MISSTTTALPTSTYRAGEYCARLANWIWFKRSCQKGEPSARQGLASARICPTLVVGSSALARLAAASRAAYGSWILSRLWKTRCTSA